MCFQFLGSTNDVKKSGALWIMLSPGFEKEDTIRSFWLSIRFLYWSPLEEIHRYQSSTEGRSMHGLKEDTISGCLVCYKSLLLYHCNCTFVNPSYWMICCLWANMFFLCQLVTIIKLSKDAFHCKTSLLKSCLDSVCTVK